MSNLVACSGRPRRGLQAGSHAEISLMGATHTLPSHVALEFQRQLRQLARYNPSNRLSVASNLAAHLAASSSHPRRWLQAGSHAETSSPDATHTLIGHISLGFQRQSRQEARCNPSNRLSVVSNLAACSGRPRRWLQTGSHAELSSPYSAHTLPSHSSLGYQRQLRQLARCNPSN